MPRELQVHGTHQVHRSNRPAISVSALAVRVSHRRPTRRRKSPRRPSWDPRNQSNCTTASTTGFMGTPVISALHIPCNRVCVHDGGGREHGDGRGPLKRERMRIWRELWPSPLDALSRSQWPPESIWYFTHACITRISDTVMLVYNACQTFFLSLSRSRSPKFLCCASLPRTVTELLS